jgi:hypothetical protein
MESTVTQQFKALSVRQVSQIPEDKLALVASYGPNGKEEFFQHSVRGVVVQTTRQTELHAGKSYRLCIFPGWRYQWVNEGNIRSRKVNKYGEIHVGNQSKLAA